MTSIATCAAIDPGIPTPGIPTSATERPKPLAVWVRQPWMVRLGTDNVLIRGTTPRDFTAVAALHARCSPRSLLERYRLGGRSPSAVAIERMLRHTLAFLACTGQGEVIGMAVASADPMHGPDGAELGLLVEDRWQRRGLGRDLLTHLAGAAYVCGYTELLTYPGPSTAVAAGLLTEIGRTYAVTDEPYSHLHTPLSESVTMGLGAIREHLAC